MKKLLFILACVLATVSMSAQDENFYTHAIRGYVYINSNSSDNAQRVNLNDSISYEVFLNLKFPTAEKNKIINDILKKKGFDNFVLSDNEGYIRIVPLSGYNVKTFIEGAELYSDLPKGFESTYSGNLDSVEDINSYRDICDIRAHRSFVAAVVLFPLSPFFGIAGLVHKHRANQARRINYYLNHK